MVRRMARVSKSIPKEPLQRSPPAVKNSSIGLNANRILSDQDYLILVFFKIDGFLLLIKSVLFSLHFSYCYDQIVIECANLILA